MATLRQLLLAGVLGLPFVAWAGGVEQLRGYLHDTRTLKAEFSQVVLGKQGKNSLSSSGMVTIARPGKLRWEIFKPYPQLMVGDGDRFWIYDPELKQVTIKKMGQAIGSTPAALLSGNNDLERNFTLRDIAASEGMVWVEAIPKSADGGFEKLRFGFVGHELKAMDLYDNFGQTTQVRFSHIERNPSLPVATFKFTPPAGADVVGE